MVTGWPESARTTAPYQTEDSSQFVTSPIIDADGATKVSFVLKGLVPLNIMLGRCRVKIYGTAELNAYVPIRFDAEPENERGMPEVGTVNKC